MDRLKRILVPVLLVVALGSVAGCKKKVIQTAPTPPPVAAPAPTAQITANPTVVTAGGHVVLTWSTSNASTASIDGLGDVPTSGVKTVTPGTSTNYHLVVKGAGGSADASVRVTVNAPPSVVAAPASTLSAEEEFKANVQDIFFDYDKYDLRSDAQATIAHDAAYLSSHPNVKVLIGGYCDERGSNDYNLALGQSRGDSAKKALIVAGVDANRIRVVSYGKERPFCTESTEDCWQKNRRAGFALDR